MFEMVFAVRDEMKVAYPELVETADRVSKVVRAEEEQFARVLNIASQHFEQVIKNTKRRDLVSIFGTHPTVDFLRDLHQQQFLGLPVDSGYRAFNDDVILAAGGVSEAVELLYTLASRGLHQWIKFSAAGW